MWTSREKNRWHIATGGAAAITVKYRVYCREMSVRTNWVEADFALLNGAPHVHHACATSHHGRTKSSSTRRRLEAVGDGVAGAGAEATTGYRAPDYDTLVDSPIVIGNPAVYDFEVDGKKHSLVNVGEGGVFDGARAARDLELIVKEDRRLWGSCRTTATSSST
jgi:predicted metalloprotease with PDZ domain